MCFFLCFVLNLALSVGKRNENSIMAQFLFTGSVFFFIAVKQFLAQLVVSYLQYVTTVCFYQSVVNSCGLVLLFIIYVNGTFQGTQHLIFFFFSIISVLFLSCN